MRDPERPNEPLIALGPIQAMCRWFNELGLLDQQHGAITLKMDYSGGDDSLLAFVVTLNGERFQTWSEVTVSRIEVAEVGT